MSETIGRLLAAGQRAEVFEFGIRVVKLCRFTGSKRVTFREASIHAAVEALGLPVPAVWGVQQIDGRWGILFDRVNGVSFAEQMRSDGAALYQYLQILAFMPTRRTSSAPLRFGWRRALPELYVSTSHESKFCSMASGTCLMAIAFAMAISIQ